MVLKLGATRGGATSSSFTGIPQFGQLSHKISSTHNISMSSLVGSLCDFAFWTDLLERTVCVKSRASLERCP
jgi:hypothetical protein